MHNNKMQKIFGYLIASNTSSISNDTLFFKIQRHQNASEYLNLNYKNNYGYGYMWGHLSDVMAKLR